jgi:hypothetical protein
MNAANVFRLISLIPERSARWQSGSLFDGKASERAELIARFLGWLGPLSSLSKEEQQLLGVRSGGGKVLAEGEGAGEGDEADEALDALDADEVHGAADDAAIRLPGAGTQIAA